MYRMESMDDTFSQQLWKKYTYYEVIHFLQHCKKQAANCPTAPAATIKTEGSVYKSVTRLLLAMVVCRRGSDSNVQVGLLTSAAILVIILHSPHNYVQTVKGGDWRIKESNHVHSLFLVLFIFILTSFYYFFPGFFWFCVLD